MCWTAADRPLARWWKWQSAREKCTFLIQGWIIFVLLLPSSFRWCFSNVGKRREVQLFSGGRKVLFSWHLKISIEISKIAIFSFQKNVSSLSFYHRLQNIIGKMMVKGEQILFILGWEKCISLWRIVMGKVIGAKRVVSSTYDANALVIARETYVSLASNPSKPRNPEFFNRKYETSGIWLPDIWDERKWNNIGVVARGQCCFTFVHSRCPEVTKRFVL